MDLDQLAEIEALIGELETSAGIVAAAPVAPVAPVASVEPVEPVKPVEPPAPVEPELKETELADAAALAELEALGAATEPQESPNPITSTTSKKEEVVKEEVAVPKSPIDEDAEALVRLEAAVEPPAPSASSLLHEELSEEDDSLGSGRYAGVVSTALGDLDFHVDVKAFQRDTMLNETNFDRAVREQAGLRAYYSAQAAYAEAQHARLKVKFSLLEAKLYDHHRKALAASGEKVTEKMVESAVNMDPRWFKAKNAVIEAETIATVNKGIVGSLADRRDMIIQMGADRRNDYEGQLRVLSARNEALDLSSRASAGAKAILKSA